DSLQLRREFRVQLHWRNGNLIENGVKNCRRGASFEGQPPRTHFIQHYAEREHVRARVQFFAESLLRAHVCNCSQRSARRSQLFETDASADSDRGCFWLQYLAALCHD